MSRLMVALSANPSNSDYTSYVEELRDSSVYDDELLTKYTPYSEESYQIPLSDNEQLSHNSDTDIEQPDDTQPSEKEIGRTIYKLACERFQIAESTKVLNELGTRCLKLKYRNLGPLSLKALAYALKENTIVEYIDIEENGFDEESALLFISMLKYNNYITSVNFSGNHMSGNVCQSIGYLLRIDLCLTYLNLTNCGLRDTDAEYICEGLKTNGRLTEIILSRNIFSITGGIVFGRMLKINQGLRKLDLSWNNIRFKGAVTICDGIKNNISLKEIDISWNGFGYDGSLAVCSMLKQNKTLKRLNIGNNRIDYRSAKLIAKGLASNRTLRELKISHNPITMTGCLDILKAISQGDSCVENLELKGIVVDKKIVYIAEMISNERKFSIAHDRQVASEDVLGRTSALPKWDPLKLLVQFLYDKSIRPVDLFRQFDRDNQQMVSKEHFIRGLKKAQVPLNDREIDMVSDKLYSSKHSKINYPILMEGFKEQMNANRENEKKKKIEEKRITDDHKRIMKLHLPPISEKMKDNNSEYSSSNKHTIPSDRPSSQSSSVSSSLSNARHRKLSFEITRKLSSFSMKSKNTNEYFEDNQDLLKSRESPSMGMTNWPAQSTVKMSGPLNSHAMHYRTFHDTQRLQIQQESNYQTVKRKRKKK